MFTKDTALVVDDSQQIVNLVSKMLKERLKFGRVVALTDAKEALQTLKEEQIDWVISDWEMPGVSGLDLLKQVRSDPKMTDIPFILMSSRADKESLVEAVSAGVSDYISKPFSPAKLDEKLRRFLHIKDRRQDIRVSPTDTYICEVVATDDKKYNTELINISISGCLLKTPVARAGIYIYDALPIQLKLGETNLKLKAEVVRLDSVKDDAQDASQFMTMAVKFLELDSESKIALTNFINKYRIN
ncbi:MAG: response regulator [Gammaproteobacteria bacterium]|nr:response regulator [Gammaproteobacteria bacterium]